MGSDAVTGSRVLDLYAGTGALGLEALSRGVAWVDFVEHRRALCNLIRSSLASIGSAEKAQVYCTKVERIVDNLPGDYDLVFMDPPYKSQVIEPLMLRLNREGLLKEGGTIVVEHSHLITLQGAYGRVRQTNRRRYGDTCLSIFQLGGLDD